MQTILSDYVCNDTAEARQGENGAVAPACDIIVSYEAQGVRGNIVLGQKWRVTLHDDLLYKLKEQYGENRIALNY